MKKRYLIETWGCQMNEHDSEKISGILETLNYEKCNEREEADIIIFNTCLVRENAALKVYGNLGALKNLKKSKPELIIAVCGCMMQRKDVRDTISKKYRFVDLIFGTHNIHKLPELLANVSQTSKMLVDVWEDNGEIIENIPTNRSHNYKAYVNIMFGCDNFCSYCIVPYTRGREKSRHPEDIIKEVNELVKQDCKEITLLGQNVNSYGKTLNEKLTFAELLLMLNKIDGIERIRFMTSNPKDLSDELIDVMKECDKVCGHLHLPFQAGSNKILKVMNRKYTKEQYLQLVEKVREELPETTLTTDIIVGFPGETDEDFEHTLDIVRKAKFDSAFTYLYSIREGTPAAKMENQVPDIEKHERFQRLLDVIKPISLESNQNLIGKTVKILIEGISKNDDTMLTGRTEGNKLVHVKGDLNLISKIVNVKITSAKTWFLQGEIVK